MRDSIEVTMSTDEVVVEDKRWLTSCNTPFTLWERFNLGGTGLPCFTV